MTHPLLDVVQHLKNGNVRTAHQLLHSLDYDQATHMKEYVFANALKKKLDINYVENQNLYFSEPDGNESQIDLFNVLAKVPLFNCSYSIGNSLIAHGIVESNLEHVFYMDLGVGRGRQTVAIMKSVAQSHRPPKKFTIIGLEPAQASLEIACAAITEAAKSLPFDVEFIGLNKCAEALSPEEWGMLHNRFGGKLIISAAYSLHHIVSDPLAEDKRDRVLQALCRLKPIRFVLLEGNANNNIDDFFQRFRSCWDLYGRCFDMVDALSELTEEEKTALKIGFFAREIEDILAKDKMENRHERLEPLSTWVDRIINAGFSLEDEAANCVPEEVHPAISVGKYRGYVGIDYMDTSIVGVLSAQSA